MKHTPLMFLLLIVSGNALAQPMPATPTVADAPARMVERPAKELTLAPLWEISAPTGDWFGTGGTERGLAYNPATGHLLVASRKGGATAEIVNAQTGEVVGSLENTGIVGGTFPINQIAATSDGQIFAANLTLRGSDPVRIYRWANETAAPQLVFDGVIAAGTDSVRFGDALGAWGAENDVTLLLSGSNMGMIGKFKWNGVRLTRDGTFRVPEIVGRGGFSSSLDGESVFASGTGAAPRALSLTDGSIRAMLSSAEVSAIDLNSVMHIDAYRMGDRTYVAAGPAFTTGQFYVFLLAESGSRLQLVTTLGPLGGNANRNNTGGVAFDPETGRLFLMDTNNALAAYRMVSAL